MRARVEKRKGSLWLGEVFMTFEVEEFCRSGPAVLCRLGEVVGKSLGKTGQK